MFLILVTMSLVSTEVAFKLSKASASSCFDDDAGCSDAQIV